MVRRIVGITGGIGTGKSAVARILSTFSIPIADADILAREAVAPGSEILERIVQQFGARIVTADGTLDRQHLGAIAFSQPDARTWLEEQIHPYVRSRLEAFIAEHDETPVIALVIPLLFEAGMADLVDEIWTVTCTSAQQRQRLQQRDNLSNEQIEARIASQWPLAEKIERSDRVLDNSGSLDELVRQVMAALELLEGESTDIPSLQ